jgi:hypothetical protein
MDMSMNVVSATILVTQMEVMLALLTVVEVQLSMETVSRTTAQQSTIVQNVDQAFLCTLLNLRVKSYSTVHALFSLRLPVINVKKDTFCLLELAGNSLELEPFVPGKCKRLLHL